jgi:hypothetical protein
LDRPIFFKTIILKGRDGTSIGSLEKTATVGVTDTYTITLTDGETYTFEVTNGTSISNISYTSSSGNVDTYTITLTDGSTQTFQVTNGEDFTVPTDGVIYYDGTDVPDGYEETSAPAGSGAYATIDDNTASVSTTYSSSKIEQLISGIGGGGVDYSETEQDTGLKWIDGKPIYQKTFNHLTFTNEFAAVDITALSVDKVMKFEGGVYGSSGDFVPFGYGQEVAIYVAEATTMSIVNRFASSRESGYATIYYTKTTDTV